MVRFRLLLPCLLLLLAACQSSAIVDNEDGRDYRFIFEDGSWLQAPADLQAVVTFATGEELWLRLHAVSGEMASRAARAWVRSINRRRPYSAEMSSNTFVLRGVVRIEPLGRIRGLRIREVPRRPAPEAAEADGS